MEYITVYETFRPNEAVLLKTLFEENGVQYRELKKPVDPVVPKGIRLQVTEDKQDKAIQILRENGFLGRRLAQTNEQPSGKFWIYLFFALLIVVVVAVLIFINL